MIQAVLYCSYKGSPVGYQMSLADLSQETLTSVSSGRAKVPENIKNYFSHGGANCVCGYDIQDRVYFLLFKRMELEDDSKRFDEMGRKIFINVAFFSADVKEITSFTKGFFAQYQAVKQAFADVLLLQNNELGYHINFAVFRKVVDSCLSFGQSKQCRDIFRIAYDSGHAVSFVSLEAGWDYFAQMCKIPVGVKPVKMINISEMWGSIQKTSDTLFVGANEPVIPSKPKQEPQPTLQPQSKPQFKSQPKPNVTQETFEEWTDDHFTQHQRLEQRLSQTYATANEAKQYIQRQTETLRKLQLPIKVAIAIASCAVVVAVVGLILAILK